MRYYPIFLDLRGRGCLVVGGGRVAERKVRALLRAGATVRVISPQASPQLAKLAADQKIELIRRAYRSRDLARLAPHQRLREPSEPLLVFVATDDPAVQAMVRQDAAALGILVNAADDLHQSDFIVPASFEQGDLHVAISTSGASPALARRLRQQLQGTLGREYRQKLRALRTARQELKNTVDDQTRRAKLLRQLVGHLTNREP